jgi:hypothetical protein
MVSRGCAKGPESKYAESGVDEQVRDPHGIAFYVALFVELYVPILLLARSRRSADAVAQLGVRQA